MDLRVRAGVGKGQQGKKSDSTERHLFCFVGFGLFMGYVDSKKIVK